MSNFLGSYHFQRLLKYSRLFFTERIKVSWGGYSLIRCEMILFCTALQNGEYSYLHILSGVDFPLKPIDEIYNFFEDIRGKEFVSILNELDEDEVGRRIKYYYIFQEKTGKNKRFILRAIKGLFWRIQKMCGINRIKHLKVAYGSQWNSISFDFAKYIISKTKFIKKHFRFCYCGDELFIQTLLINSNFMKKNYQGNNNLRYIDWNRGNESSPYIFRSNDFNELINSGCLFARKFDMSKDKEICEKIFNYVRTKN